MRHKICKTFAKLNYKRGIKKFKKITLRILAGILLVFLLLFILLSIPVVQTRLGKLATQKINDRYKTDISINKVGLKWNGDVKIKEVYIADHHADTLIYVDALATSILSAKKAIDGNLDLGAIDMDRVKQNDR